ncbi:unnamed protein product [Meganyctiphanes norvegica]|uniref:NACHT domain-containing protein n=1 Tax=Meganyctiphanes norvegica TaxID=48144 RepID=A0AAV2RLD9_MEGNR
MPLIISSLSATFDECFFIPPDSQAYLQVHKQNTITPSKSNEPWSELKRIDPLTDETCRKELYQTYNDSMINETCRTSSYIKGYDTNRGSQPKCIVNTITAQVGSMFNSLYKSVNNAVKRVDLWYFGRDRVLAKVSVCKHTSGSFTDHATLHHIQANSTKSSGNLDLPSKLIMAICIYLMYYSASSSLAGLGLTPAVSDDEINKLKIIHILNTVGREVLLAVYQNLKPFSNSTNIKDHLLNDLHMPENLFRDNFNATMIHAIENNPNSGEAYDISLLIKCIKVLSKQYEPRSQWKWRDDNELECRCQKLADKRNNEFHSFSGISCTEMRMQFDAIEKLLMDILNSLQVRFPREATQLNDMKRDIQDRLSNILTSPMGKSEIRICLLQKYKKLLLDEITLYKDRCKEWGKLKILDFLLGSKTFHDVKILFTEVIVKKSNRHHLNTQVKCTAILKLASSSTSSILLIDSEAGGGKTTIFRFGINDWGEGGSVMGTASYDYIFPMEFRNPHIGSVRDLIKCLIPNVCNNSCMDDIMECLTNPSQSIMFFCDGFDEKNEKSLLLFNEICDLKEKYPHIRIVVTSRPESVREFYYTIGINHSIEHVQVLGIHESKRGEFLKKYHDEFITAGQSKESSEDLLKFYARCSARHKDLYRLPINLVILAWLWGLNPQKAKTIKSAAGLYTAIVDILNEKLIRRVVQSHSDVMHKFKGDMDKLKYLIECFKEKIYSESLSAVRFDRIFIDDTGVTNLREFCEDKGLPFLELKGVYLLSKLEWETVNDVKEILELPHKGFLDYYAAKCIEYKLRKITKENRNKENRHT